MRTGCCCNLFFQKPFQSNFNSYRHSIRHSNQRVLRRRHRVLLRQHWRELARVSRTRWRSFLLGVWRDYSQAGHASRFWALHLSFGVIGGAVEYGGALCHASCEDDVHLLLDCPSWAVSRARRFPFLGDFASQLSPSDLLRLIVGADAGDGDIERSFLHKLTLAGAGFLRDQGIDDARERLLVPFHIRLLPVLDFFSLTMISRRRLLSQVEAAGALRAEVPRCTAVLAGHVVSLSVGRQLWQIPIVSAEVTSDISTAEHDLRRDAS